MNEWVNVAAIMASIFTGLGLLGAWLSSQRKTIMTEIRRSVSDLAVLLTEKLETKEKVAGLAREVAVLSEKIDRRHQGSG